MSRFVLPTARLVARRAAIVPARTFHRSAPVLATEVPPNPLTDPRIKAFQEKLQAAPAAFEAVGKLGEILHSKGVDPTTPPSKMKMASLMFDKEVRAAIETMMAECKKAGIELDPSALQALAGGKKE